jgi:hypothetical protein
VLRTVPMLLAAALVLRLAPSASAQTAELLPAPTLPSDTLEANYAPHSGLAPMPEMAPSLPSDTLDATQPVDSFPTDDGWSDSSSSSLSPDDIFPQAAPETSSDSAALREIKDWIRHHRDVMAPPPARAVLLKA